MKNYIQFILENNNITDSERLAWKKIYEVLIGVSNKHSFFADILVKMRVLIDNSEGNDTMCTDGKSIFFNSDFVNKLSFDEAVFVICHEILHIVLLSFARRNGKNPLLWNWATDYAINLLLKESNIGKPPKWKDEKGKECGVLLDDKYKDMAAEKIYDLLLEELKKKGKGKGQSGQGKGQGTPQPGSGTPQPGQGQGMPQPGDGDIDPNLENEDIQDATGEKGKPIDKVKDSGTLSDKADKAAEKDINKEIKETFPGDPEIKESTPGDLERKWKDKINESNRKNQGSGSAGIDRHLKGLTERQINWKSELKKFISDIFDKYGYKIPDRRSIYRDEYAWGGVDEESDFESAVIAVDTSGSIGDEELIKFGTEIKSLCVTRGVKKIFIVYCDASIPRDGVQIFTSKNFKIEKMRPKGGGGTSFVPPFEWINKNLKGKLPSFVLYFTDSYGDCPPITMVRKYKDRIMWIVSGGAEAKNLIFGKKLRLR